jgi:sterol 14-demethylase
MTAETEYFFDKELGLSATSTSNSKTVEIFHSMSELIILTASRALQGKEVRNGLNSKYAKIFWDLDAGFIPVNFMFTNLPLPVNVRRDKAHKQISEFYQTIIRKRRTGEVVSVCLSL